MVLVMGRFRPLGEMLQNSSPQFTLYRAWQIATEKIRETLLLSVWRSALGSCGHGTRISPGIKLVLPRKIHLGRECYLAARVHLTTESNEAELKIGDRAFVNSGSRIDFTGGVKIGDDFLASEDVLIFTHDHLPDDFNKKKSSPLEVGNRVWVGARAIVLPSVRRIGSNVVIGAGSVVTSEIADSVIVAGNPARVVSKVG